MFLKTLFGGGIGEVANVVGDALDKFSHTDQEKAEANAAGRQLIVEWVGQSKGQNLSRRLLALMISGIWLLQYIGAWAIDIAQIFVRDPETVENLMLVSATISDRAVQMNGAMMLILGFYFAAPHLDKFVGPALAAFNKNKTKDPAA